MRRRRLCVEYTGQIRPEDPEDTESGPHRKSPILRPQNTSESYSGRLCRVSQQCHSTGDGRSLVEVLHRKSAKMLNFRRIGVSWGLSGMCVGRVDGQTC